MNGHIVVKPYRTLYLYLHIDIFILYLHINRQIHGKKSSNKQQLFNII